MQGEDANTQILVGLFYTVHIFNDLKYFTKCIILHCSM